MKRTLLAGILLFCALRPAIAQEMSQGELEGLLAGGRTIGLGGPGQGYAGTLDLRPDGTGSGRATTDAGQVLEISGTWEVRDGKFCRRWEQFNDGVEVCETWLKTGEGAIDVMVDGQKAGTNTY